jgi:hypothetical protein
VENLENMIVEVTLQLFICQVNAELLKTVRLMRAEQLITRGSNAYEYSNGNTSNISKPKISSTPIDSCTGPSTRNPSSQFLHREADAICTPGSTALFKRSTTQSKQREYVPLQRPSCVSIAFHRKDLSRKNS